MRKKTTRRTFIKAGVAVAGGVALASTYVRPETQSIALHETAYASGVPDEDEGKGKAKGKGKGKE